MAFARLMAPRNGFDIRRIAKEQNGSSFRLVEALRSPKGTKKGNKKKNKMRVCTCFSALAILCGQALANPRKASI
jgi:hypothetical protein